MRRSRSTCALFLALAIAAIAIFALAKALRDRNKAREPVEQLIALRISHPGFESGEPQPHEVRLLSDADGSPLAYRTTVKSVFCSEDHCDVIHVEIAWDGIGRYAGYRLQPGDRLTKYDHEPFDAADYEKFGDLLHDAGSILGSTEKDTMVLPAGKAPAGKAPKTAGPVPQRPSSAPRNHEGSFEQVDAVSGATALHVRDQVVEGAAYTCYALWHWANGDLAAKLRAHAGIACSEEKLRSYLRSADPGEVAFALASCSERKLFDVGTQDLAAAAHRACDDGGFLHLLRYLDLAEAAVGGSGQRWAALFADLTGVRRVTFLEFLLGRDQQPPQGFFAEAGRHLGGIESFYAFQLFLSLVEKHDADSAAIRQQVAGFLDHRNFFLARRACEYLDGRELDGETSRRLTEFRQRHRDRL